MAKGKSGAGRIIAALVAALILLPVIAIGVFLATFDPNLYRDEIAARLSEQTGRTIRLNGPLHVGLSGGGLVLQADDVTVANPDWASRKDFARIGQVGFSLALAPLLGKRVEIDRLTIAQADVQLETGSGEKNNWNFMPPKPTATSEATDTAAQPAVTKGQGEGQGVAFQLDAITLKTTRLAYRDGKTGEVTEILIEDTTLNPTGKADLQVSGKHGVQEFALDLTGGPWPDLAAGKDWPFQVSATYAGTDLAGTGHVQTIDKGKRIAFDTLDVNYGGSRIGGKIAIVTGGAKPKISGALTADVLPPPNPPEGSAKGAAQTQGASQRSGAEPTTTGNRIFSDEELNLSPLKSVNADLDLTIAKVAMGDMALDQVTTHVALADGRLTLAPLKAALAGNPLEARLVVDAAATPPSVAMALSGDQVNVGQILQAMGHDQLIVGKGNLEADLKGAGKSPHEVAGTLNGKINFDIGAGTIPSEGLKHYAANLLQVLMPGSEALAQPQLTCLAARLQAQDGMLRSNGLLLETNLATVAGIGAIDLRHETVTMALTPRPKAQSLLPGVVPLKISGPLQKPSYVFDAGAAAQMAAGAFLGMPLGANGGVRVPVVDPAAAGGQNPCVYALEHPRYAPETTPKLPPALEDARTKAQEKAKELLDKAGEGLGLKNLFLK